MRRERLWRRKTPFDASASTTTEEGVDVVKSKRQCGGIESKHSLEKQVSKIPGGGGGGVTCLHLGKCFPP
jgi:hypothetical protein